ncbi:MAG: hypothetical protein Q9M11_03435 [Mariprofundaceae bacterium]|nr:hypothetical protein [Mariprofundaceae bacterium]
MNKMIIHYCGGAGINIARAINTTLSTLGDGFCSVTPKYLDTSVNNIGDLPKEDFWKVDHGGFSDNTIAGSGGERVTNSTAIMKNIKDYLDTHGYTEESVGEYHIVMFSASGGTGSVLGPALIMNLRERGLSVLAIMIGDSSNGLSCINTLNTMATLDHISKNVINKPISMIYYNNHTVSGANARDKERAVNGKVTSALTFMSLFLSGDNEDIDTRDMINFLSPDNYSTITVGAGVYCVEITTNGTVKNNKSNINIIGRTLCGPGQDADVGLTLLQHKYGKVVNANALSVTEIDLPVHMILAGNCLVTESILLKNTSEEYDNIMASLEATDLVGKGTADASGMIF